MLEELWKDVKICERPKRAEIKGIKREENKLKNADKQMDRQTLALLELLEEPNALLNQTCREKLIN